MRKALEDLGYTAVGLGVLALQEVQVRRRQTRERLSAHVREVRQRVEWLSRTLHDWVDPVASRLPRPPVPSLLTRALETGKAQVDSVLRRRPPSDSTRAAA